MKNLAGFSQIPQPSSSLRIFLGCLKNPRSRGASELLLIAMLNVIYFLGQEDLYRIEILFNKYKILPYVMPYNQKNKYQRDFRRWVNAKNIFKSVKWQDYKKKKYN